MLVASFELMLNEPAGQREKGKDARILGSSFASSEVAKGANILPAALILHVHV